MVPSPRSQEYVSASPSASVALIASAIDEPSGPLYDPPTDATGSAFGTTTATRPTATLSTSNALPAPEIVNRKPVRNAPGWDNVMPTNRRPVVVTGTSMLVKV